MARLNVVPNSVPMMEQKPMPRTGAAIKIKDLWKVYGEDDRQVVALQDINFEVEAGEFLCIVGPSGCGKSTLLRILAGLDTQTAGSVDVSLDGWAVGNAMVFQESGLFPWMTVEENVGFGLETRGVPKSERAERVAEALGLVGLSRFAKHYPHQLSGGMRQRGGIARAFVADPAMLLMDEPFAALDAQNRHILQDELRKIWEATGKTVVYITHSIDEALFLGNRVAIMTAQPGRIKEIIDVPFAQPRDLLTLSATPEFGNMKVDIWKTLEEEVNKARENDQ